MGVFRYFFVVETSRGRDKNKLERKQKKNSLEHIERETGKKMALILF